MWLNGRGRGGSSPPGVMKMLPVGEEDDAVGEGFERSSFLRPGRRGWTFMSWGRRIILGSGFDGEEICVVSGDGGDTIFVNLHNSGTTAHGEDLPPATASYMIGVAVHGVRRRSLGWLREKCCRCRL